MLRYHDHMKWKSSHLRWELITFSSTRKHLAGCHFLCLSIGLHTLDFPILTNGKGESNRVYSMTPQTVYIKSGFTMVPNQVLLDTALSAKALRLFEVLEHHSGEHKTCWVGYPKLAEEVGCSVKWLPSVIKKLVEGGYLHVQYRQGKTNIYTLLLRVERSVKAPIQVTAPLPMQSTEYEQKQPTKTNIKGVQPPFIPRQTAKQAGANAWIARELAKRAAKKRR